MSYPLEQPPPPPPPPAPVFEMVSSKNGGGSYGPLIGVLAVIILLAVIAGIVGRLCSGRRILGHGYDFEGWIERKCAACIDGSVELHPPPTPPPPPPPAGGAGPGANGGASDAGAAATGGAGPGGKQAAPNPACMAET